MGYTIDQVTWWSDACARREAGIMAALLVRASSDQVSIVMRALGGR